METDKFEQLEKEITEIKERNFRVEQDKEWETSLTRKLIVAAVTYVLIGLYMVFLGVNRPWLNAFVPTAGFLLSTLSIAWAKSIWVRANKK